MYIMHQILQRRNELFFAEHIYSVFWYTNWNHFIKSLSVLCVVAQSCLTLCDPMDCSPPGPSVHEDSPGKEYWSGLPCPPPGILPTQLSNSGLPLCRWILYLLSHQGNPKSSIRIFLRALKLDIFLFSKI